MRTGKDRLRFHRVANVPIQPAHKKATDCKHRLPLESQLPRFMQFAEELFLLLFVVDFFFLDLLLLLATGDGLRHFCLRDAKDAFGFVPAIFVRKLCDTFCSLHYVSGSDQPTAAFQALIKTHRTYLQICNPALKRGILRVWLNFSAKSRNHRPREAKKSKPDGIRLQLAESIPPIVVMSRRQSPMRTG